MKKFLFHIFFLAIGTACMAQQQTSPYNSGDEMVFTKVEVMPEFPGGDEAMNKYISQNLVYPPAAVKDKVSGKVMTTFVVGNDGVVKNAKVLRGVREDVDNEAIRVITSMPKWKPGVQNGKPVSVQMTLPIHYQPK